MEIDLRSDTVTRPTAAMREAMSRAEVGDDVIDIDPTVAELEAYTAELLGKEAAIFMPSGTMTNQIAIRVHCKPGDEFLCEEFCHIYNWEQGAFAQLSGLVARTIPGQDGILNVAQLRDKVRPLSEHSVRTKLICLENTHNRGGGRVWPYEQLVEVCEWAHEVGLTRHLDGARLFNAAVASGISERQWSEHFESVSVCFSKGLGAPVGSALAGSREFIKEARRARKLFGGGMRQAGIIAAGALYALKNHRDRVAQDHEHAKLLAESVREIASVALVPAQVDTNIVVLELGESLPAARDVVEALKTRGLRAMAISQRHVRLVTHLDVDADQIRQACEILPETLTELAGTSISSEMNA